MASLDPNFLGHPSDPIAVIVENILYRDSACHPGRDWNPGLGGRSVYRIRSNLCVFPKDPCRESLHARGHCWPGLCFLTSCQAQWFKASSSPLTWLARNLAGLRTGFSSAGSVCHASAPSPAKCASLHGAEGPWRCRAVQTWRSSGSTKAKPGRSEREDVLRRRVPAVAFLCRTTMGIKQVLGGGCQLLLDKQPSFLNVAVVSPNVGKQSIHGSHGIWSICIYYEWCKNCMKHQYVSILVPSWILWDNLPQNRQLCSSLIYLICTKISFGTYKFRVGSRRLLKMKNHHFSEILIKEIRWSWDSATNLTKNGSVWFFIPFVVCIICIIKMNP